MATIMLSEAMTVPKGTSGITGVTDITVIDAVTSPALLFTHIEAFSISPFKPVFGFCGKVIAEPTFYL
jgi:hypothetical protein